MLFPAKRIRFSSTYQGKSEPGGWITLDLAGTEMEGVTKIFIAGADIDTIRSRGDVTSDRLKQARSLLRGEDGDTN